MKPIPYKQEMGDTERLPCPGAPQGSAQFYLHHRNLKTARIRAFLSGEPVIFISTPLIGLLVLSEELTNKQTDQAGLPSLKRSSGSPSPHKAGLKGDLKLLVPPMW